MPIFTVLLDYAGGIYIDQVRARSVDAAVASWVLRLPEQGVPGIKARAAERLGRNLADQRAVPIEGVVSVWCTTALVRGNLAVINLVRTDVPGFAGARR